MIQIRPAIGRPDTGSMCEGRGEVRGWLRALWADDWTRSLDKARVLHVYM